MATSFSFEAIGTWWQVDIYEIISPEDEIGLRRAILSRIEIFDATYSRFRSDSIVTKMAKEKGEYILPDDALPIVFLYRDLYEITDGLMTPLIGQMLVDAGYDAQYSLTQKRSFVRPPLWEEVMEYRPPVLIMKRPTLLDFGAAGKGYLVDIVAGIIKTYEIANFCIDAGGDIFHQNITPIRVGLEHPGDTTKVIGVIELQNKSLCGSATNRRVWGNFHHIMHPKALAPVDGICAVWVISDTAMLADAIATCLFFVSPTLLQKYQFEYLLVRSDFSIEKSNGFICTLF